MVQFNKKKKKGIKTKCISSSPLSLFAEPSFVFADVIREGLNRVEGEDDKIYFFFTEVSVEYEFFGKLLIPRVARVCKVRAPQHPTFKFWTDDEVFILNVYYKDHLRFSICS